MYNTYYPNGAEYGWNSGGMMGHSFAVGAGAPDWALALFAFLGPLILLVVLWSLFWKGLALWHAGRRGQPWWFVIMLVINTAGILEIIYLFFVAKLKWSELFAKHEPHHHS